MGTSQGCSEEKNKPVKRTSHSLPPKHASSSPSVITSIKKNCTCCFLHPIGSAASSWGSSSLSSLSEPSRIPLLICDLVQKGAIDRPKISFQAHSASSKSVNNDKRWDRWVKAMSLEKKFVATWHQAGIADAIIVASVCDDIRIDRQAIEALLGFWCSLTNTFVFPWGEAGITFEDIHVLTGLPIRGSQLDQELTDEEEELYNRLIVEHEKILVLNDEAQRVGMVTHDIWLNWFMTMDDIDDELRHLGFLTYWLCKDVFLSSKPAQAAIYKLAARLSIGVRIALAPALVANIYHNLNAITELLISSQWKKRRGVQLRVWASFSILQCWVWERFENLRPNTYGPISQRSRARISRWSGKQKPIKYHEAVEIYQDELCFAWRPYSHRLSNWVEPDWYAMESRSITIKGEGAPDYAYDFLALVSCTSVKGLSGDYQIFCERYNPNRVARQFGFDQAIPGSSVACQSSNNHESFAAGLRVWIPGVTRCGNPTRDYVKWWKAYTKSNREALRGCITAESVMGKTGNEVQKKGKKKNDTVFQNSSDEKHNVVCKRRKTEEINRSPLIIGREVGSKTKQIPTTDTSIKTAPPGSLYLFCGKAAHDCQVRSSITKGENSAAADVKIIGNKNSNALVIDIDGEDLAIYDALPQPQDLTRSDKAYSIKENERILVKELEEFERLGLMTYHEPSSETEKRSKTSIEKNEDPYGQEAIDRYPQFFKLIPQHPHYRGLLKGGNIIEEMKKDIFLGQWYMLVSLMGEALRTNSRTDAMGIERLINKAQTLKECGFDVRHLIARLTLAQKIQPNKLEGKVAVPERRFRELGSKLIWENAR